MRNRKQRWLTVQQTSVMMGTTSAEVCRLLNLRRLSGSKEKQPGRPGKAQWLIDPKSVVEEQRRRAKRQLTQQVSKSDRVS